MPLNLKDGRRLMCKTFLAACAGLLFLSVATDPGRAAAACTDWVHLAGNARDMDMSNDRGKGSCVRDVESQSQRAGYRSQVTQDTLFFWFGDDVVTARCLTRTLVVFASYDYRSQNACPLLNQIKNTLRFQ
jgi:hypothetical protein